MPLIDLTLPEGALEPEALDTAMEKMTGALLRHEGATDNEATRVMSRGLVHELPAHHVYLGGRPAEEPTYQVVLGVPAGTLLHGPGPVGTTSRKAVVREMTEILLDAEGSEFTARNAARVFCLVREVPEGHWGGMGTVFGMADIVALANEEAPQTEASREGREALESYATAQGAAA